MFPLFELLVIFWGQGLAIYMCEPGEARVYPEYHAYPVFGKYVICPSVKVYFNFLYFLKPKGPDLASTFLGGLPI